MSTLSRVLIGFVLLLAAGIYSLQNHLIERIERQYFEAVEESMVDYSQIFAALLEQEAGESGELKVETVRAVFQSASKRVFSARIYNLLKSELTTHLYVTNAQGIVVFDSNGGAAEGQDYSPMRDVRLTLMGRYGARSTRTNPGDDRTSVMFVAAPIQRAGETIGVVSVSKPQSSVFPFVGETEARIRGLSLLFFLTVTCGAVLLATFFARPIARLAGYARAVGRGERPKLPRLGPPELRKLGAAFEEMRDALEDRKYVESYVQTLTHEMKSPVAAIRGAAELLGEDLPRDRHDQFVANIQAEARRLQKIIDQLLALSAIESRKALEQPEPIALTEFLRGIHAQMQPGAEARGLNLSFVVHAQPVVMGEAFLLEIALTNLVQNAIEFSPKTGSITIELMVDPVKDCAQIIVQDEGVGIPPYALTRIFERFFSLQHPATGRKSSGLGLCFVVEAVELHGGAIAITNREDRSGVRAVLSLPLARK